MRTGFFKTRVSSEDGREQVTGFQMAGELLGLDGIGSERHTSDAVALEDSQVCVIQYGQLEELSREFTDLQRQFHKVMSREIVRDHGVMLLLGSMRAEERLAAFLLNLAQRLKAIQTTLAAKVQELRELTEWKRWANLGVQEQLCAKMEALSSLEDPPEIARQVRALQEQWREASDVPRPQGDALWRRFKAAHDVVWARCAAYFAA